MTLAPGQSVITANHLLGWQYTLLSVEGPRTRWEARNFTSSL
jgi:hypothetical protein